MYNCQGNRSPMNGNKEITNDFPDSLSCNLRKISNSKMEPISIEHQPMKKQKTFLEAEMSKLSSDHSEFSLVSKPKNEPNISIPIDIYKPTAMRRRISIQGLLSESPIQDLTINVMFQQPIVNISPPEASQISPPMTFSDGIASTSKTSSSETLRSTSAPSRTTSPRFDTENYEEFKLMVLGKTVDLVLYEEKCQLIAMAAIVGDLQTIDSLIRIFYVHPGIKNNITLIEASRCGHFNVVDYLMDNPRVNPSDQRHYAMKMAVQHGHLQVLQRLLQSPKVDPSFDQNYALRTAVANGNVEMVKVLLKDKRVDPTVRDNYVIRTAAKCGHDEIVGLLLADPRIDKTSVINSASKNKKLYKSLLEKFSHILKQ
jgi:hypothetical protein